MQNTEKNSLWRALARTCRILDNLWEIGWLSGLKHYISNIRMCWKEDELIVVIINKILKNQFYRILLQRSREPLILSYRFWASSILWAEPLWLNHPGMFQETSIALASCKKKHIFSNQDDNRNFSSELNKPSR